MPRNSREHRARALFVFACSIGFWAATTAAQDSNASAVAHADSLYGAGSWADAAKAYAKLAKATPENWRLWHRYGSSLLQAGDAKGAIPVLEKAEAVGHNQATMYNLACALVRTKQPDRAIEWLAKTAEAGYNRTAQLEADTDLVPLHTLRGGRQCASRWTETPDPASTTIATGSWNSGWATGT